MTDFTLTRQEMILLHLLQYIDVTPNGYTMPFAQTQDGIGMAAGMSRSYVATVVGILEDKGLVTWVSTHPKGSRVRMRAYYLLPPGIQRAKEISARLENIEVSIEDVIERPGSTARDANIARAVMELEQAAESARASGDDLSGIRAAISHASMAINHLSKEAM